ncbi:MAG: hypothetical protein IKZ03_02065, partial [Clostridia bacterium]|nr:hypothetical protein [Clostridia bacterium]
MADNKKKSGTAKGTAKGNGSKKTTPGGAKKPAPRKKETVVTLPPEDMKVKTLHGDTNPFLSQLTPYIMGVVAVFLGVCIYAGGNAGIVGGWIRGVLLGLVGGVSYIFPILLLMEAVKYTRDRADGVVVS